MSVAFVSMAAALCLSGCALRQVLSRDDYHPPLEPGRYIINCPGPHEAQLTVGDDGYVQFTYYTSEPNECIEIICEGEKTFTGQVVMTQTGVAHHVTAYNGHAWSVRSITFTNEVSRSAYPADEALKLSP